jgi:hypothetical protein
MSQSKPFYAVEAARNRQEGGDHYLEMGIQPWDAMEAWMTHEQFIGFLLGNTIKYLARFDAKTPNKGGLPDLKKALHYIEKLIEVEERE